MSNVIKERVGKTNYKQVNRYLARESRKYGDRMEEVPKEQWPDSDVVNVANIRHLFVLPEKSTYNWSNK